MDDLRGVVNPPPQPNATHSDPTQYSKQKINVVSWDTSHVLVHEFMSIYYALAGWSGNRERRDERTKRKGKEKVRSRSKIPISSKPAVRNFVPKNLSSEILCSYNNRHIGFLSEKPDL
ncbi:hypothetical protein EVAR_88708_1 [Eumeta japonica]|uniref:Uncharacterized protein n=1 Tax=Eumeta variegata TaxID=151549 RepID=A0A4C1Y034_EUMVA|nr:hypothetical protein EVAR_88708_1 [Eumeta japonica]